MKKILLTQGKYTLVDNEDYNELSKYNWCFNGGYAKRGTSKKGHFKMHRVILKAKKGHEIDHIDGNGLNNQKINLRIATRTQNQMNRVIQKNNQSGFKGVCWDKKSKKWLSQIRIKTHTKFLGYFVNLRDAAIEYNKAAKKYFGDFANLNKI
jgi:hypothetical protein